MTTTINSGRFLTPFPARVDGSLPVTVTKTGKNYVIGGSYAGLTAELASYSASSYIVAIQHTGTNAFAKLTLANLLSGHQPLDATLTALAGLNSDTGLLEQTGADTFTKRAIGSGASTSILTKADGDALYQPVDSDLTALAALSSSGIVARTGSGAFSARTISGTSGRVTVADGNGVSGNPTIDLEVVSGLTPGPYTYANITVDTYGRVTLASSGSAPGAPAGLLSNASIGASASAGALTISLLDAAGSTPSGSSVVSIPFRSATASTGTLVNRSITTANTLVVSSGSTLGFVANRPSSIYVVAFDDGGTVRLGAINCRDSADAIHPLEAQGIAGSTAEGGAGAADSAKVFYTGTAVTSKAYTVLARVTWNAGLATAGAWTAPDAIQNMTNGTPMPGETVQRVVDRYTAYSSSSASIPIDDTIPQSTEGAQIASASITPKNAANLLRVRVSGSYAASAASWGSFACFLNSDANAFMSGHSVVSAGIWAHFIGGEGSTGMAGAGAQTVALRFGSSGATWVMNGAHGASRYFGGTQGTVLSVEEICA